MQYTLRDVPHAVDRALRELARRQGRSLNQVAIELLARAVGVSDRPIRQRDLSDVAGTWIEDDATAEVLAEQDRIEPELWE